MTTTKQIRAALENWNEAQAHFDNVAQLIVRSPQWLAWCLAQIEARDALLRRYREQCPCRDDFITDDCSMMCDLCAEARKVMEDSNG